MKKTKTISMILAITALTGIIAGCGNTDNAEEGKTKITVWGWADKDADPDGYALGQKKIEDFEKKYPDYIVEGDQYQFAVDTFAAKAEGGALPTLYNSFLTEAENIAKLGYAKPITDLLKNNGYYDMFSDYLLDMISYDGEVYFFPKDVYTLGIIANLDIFEQAGLINEDGSPMVPNTFEELADMAKIITEKTGIPGFVQATTNNVGGWLFMPIAWGYGTKFMEQQNGKWVATFDSQECANALNLIKKMKWEDNSMPAETLIDAEGAIRLVGTGQAAMTIGHPDMAKGLKNYGLDINSVGMFKMPAGTAKRVTLLGGGVEAIAPNANDEQAEAVLKWLEFDGYTPNLDDETKQRIEEDYQNRANKGEIIGILDSSVWSDATDREQYTTEMIEKYRNIDPKNVASYNDKTDIEYQAEEPKNAQELYSVLDSMLQEILTNKDADVHDLLEKAVSDFQNNSLDYAE